MEHIPKYKQAQPDKKFRKNPETFLNNKSWNDEIIEDTEKQEGKFPDKPNYTFERTLGTHELPQYWRHLRNLGYKKIGERWELQN